MVTDNEAQAEDLESIVVRFAGDSGDGMQLTGAQFTTSTALAGNALATFPDFPAEIRAPQGTTFGVSAFQINFGSSRILTPGDVPDVLVAMNPAALKTNLPMLKKGGLVLVDEGAFSKRNLQKAGYDGTPLETDLLDDYEVVKIDMSAMTMQAVKEFGLGNKDSLRCKNMWTLGLVLWMFERERAPITDWLGKKFAKIENVRDANIAALNAGHAFGETAELSTLRRRHVAAAAKDTGTYRTVTGSETLSWGLLAGCEKAGLTPFLGSYPITPASPLLHTFSQLKEFGVVTFQAEDEIAAICSALGASYAGAMGITSSSGPGIALKGEAMGL
ncbi:MAG: 2-oxoacid:acceptor oxidoreductase family protein, partial [Sphingomonadales bacterium]|nr:2-oxoacid:acceptor oxidoreductase family protein [Sphingomonadales bacterium]